MPKLNERKAARAIKLLCMGDPGTGKTGGLTSLVKAGYKLRIFDFDNLLGSLQQYVMKDCPDQADNVVTQTFTDKFKASGSPVQIHGKVLLVNSPIDGIPKAFPDAMKQLDYWKTESEDLGAPATWDEKTIVVIDSLTTMSLAAFRYVHAMNPSAAEPRTTYGAAQQMVLNVLYRLASEQFLPHVIVLAHVDYRENQLELMKGYPKSIGAALGTQIGSIFNSILLFESQGPTRKVIKTNSTGVVDLKNPVAFRVKDTLPIETGLAEFFSSVLSTTN